MGEVEVREREDKFVRSVHERLDDLISYLNSSKQSEHPLHDWICRRSVWMTDGVDMDSIAYGLIDEETTDKAYRLGFREYYNSKKREEKND